MALPLQHLGLVGYGEVGRIFSAGLHGQFQSCAAWDLKFADPATGAAAQAAAAGVQALPSMAALCTQSDFILSAVTASNTLAVAQAAAPHLRPGTVFLDLNSASPGTKQQAALVIEAAGGRYVEAGVMTSVPPYGIRVPMLLGGPLAAELAEYLNALGMDAKAVAAEIGVASAIKMCRSVMIKGLEALVIESYSTARAYGVEDYVLPTLAETFPSIDWEKQGAYFFQRVIEHGRRRSEEMHESANTVREAGMPAFSAQGTAERQAWMADRADAGSFGERGAPGFARAADWRAEADRLLQSLKEPTA